MTSRTMTFQLIKSLWPQIEPLVDELLDLDEPERSRRLDALLPGPSEARRVVELLLQADREPLDFLDRPPELADIDPTPADLPADSDLVGRHIGPYVIRREIGRGGMGTVLLAERDDGQFSQQVAIKRVRADVWTPGVRERFVAERRILAGLQHPNIARLLDGGVLEDGSPFFVMELVLGQPITAYCDARGLVLDARLRLFRQVCEAVEYAHSQLVLHRDLKPDNILVTDGGQVKLLDFGIAKILDPGSGAATGTLGHPLTPAYAAPEQFLGGALTVATDEYQLGLVLYQLLTGHRAFGRESMSPLHRQHSALEAEPERPSRAVRRLESPSAKTESAAEAMRPRPGESRSALARRLEGDLDAIVLKALEREPERRYPSVEGFRRDLESVLENRPVSARRGTRVYRLRKYARRHRLVIASAALIALSIAAGVAGVLIQTHRAERQRDLAMAAERRAGAINDFILNELLESPMPERTLGRPLAVGEVLENASRSILHAFPGQPATEAAVRMTLARTYQSLGRLDAARTQAETASHLLERHRAVASRDALEARALLGELSADQGRYDEARVALEGVLPLQVASLGAASETSIRTRAQLGRVLYLQSELARAEQLLRESLASLAKTQDEPWRLAVEVRNALAAVLADRSRARDAEALCRQSLAIQRRHLGPDHPEIARTLNQLALALTKDLRYEEAEQTLHAVVDMSQRLYGEDHPATASALSALSVAVDRLGRTDEARQLIARALGIYRRTLGNEHPNTLRVLRNLAVSTRQAGRFSEAEPLYLEVYETCLRTLGPEHTQTQHALRGIQVLRVNQGRMEDARRVALQMNRVYERVATRLDADPAVLTEYAEFLINADPEDVRQPLRAIEVASRAVGATGRKDYVSLRALGLAQRDAGRPRDAIASLREALSLPEGARSWSTEEVLAQLLDANGTAAQVESFLLERLDQQRAIRGADDRFIGKTLRLLAIHYRETHRPTEAEQRSRESLAQLLKTVPESSWEVGRARSELGAMLVARKAYVEAESLLVQGYRTLEADRDIPTIRLEEARASIVKMYVGQGRADAARSWRARVIRVRHPVIG